MFVYHSQSGVCQYVHKEKKVSPGLVLGVAGQLTFTSEPEVFLYTYYPFKKLINRKLDMKASIILALEKLGQED